jgi:hypothetical protein
MGFELIVTHMEFEIFIPTPTFHHMSIGDHDLEIVHRVEKTMGFFYHSLVNEIVSTTTVN